MFLRRPFYALKLWGIYHLDKFVTWTPAVQIPILILLTAALVSGWALVSGGALTVVVPGLVLWPLGLAVAAAGLLAAWACARCFSIRLGGLTGDGLGAGVELAELAVLLAMAAAGRLGMG